MSPSANPKSPTRSFKYSGLPPPDSRLHYIKAFAPADAIIAPTYVTTPWGSIPQYAATIRGGGPGMAYAPGSDCQGYFMSCNYQPNNNCYAYGCDIATNTFPQPGRASGGTPFSQQFTAQVVEANAVSDGLQSVGTTIDALKKHKQLNALSGHYVALLFSTPDPTVGWGGDYHWVRCDDNVNFSSWSQKDGGDQVTNFDFAGNPIINPSQSNWTVNQGPGSDSSAPSQDEITCSYVFFCYMFVPDGAANII